MELFDVVAKLVGPVQPVGETYADHARLENLKTLTELTERLLAEIRQAASCADRHEASMAKVGKHAREFLADMTANAELRGASRLHGEASLSNDVLGAAAPERN